MPNIHDKGHLVRKLLSNQTNTHVPD